MKSFVVRVVAVVAVAALAACGGDEAGSARLKSLEAGMSKQDVLAAMGVGPLTAARSDTMRVVNGFRRSSYFLNGAMYEVIYSRDLPGDVSEPLLQANETPVVFKEGKLVGWGWRFYVDEAMAKYGLPTPLRAIDTMTTPPAPAPDSVVIDSAAPAPAVTPANGSQS
jgi:hypothetical protein